MKLIAVRHKHIVYTKFMPKFTGKTEFYIVILLVIISIIANVLHPFLAKADTQTIINNKDIILKESVVGNMFPATTKETKLRPPVGIVQAVISAYTSTPDQTDDSPFIAATGKRVHDGMIAANWLPFGTKIKIPSLYGEKIFVVEDRMNPRYGFGRLDIWLDATKAEARKFGVKRVNIEILR